MKQRFEVLQHVKVDRIELVGTVHGRYGDVRLFLIKEQCFKFRDN
jgi:hypothetical protein